MVPASSQNLNRLLRDVSRSFYLTVRVLPGKVRHQIALAYLLARATDTIADTELVPINERLDALARLRSRILGKSTASLNFSKFTAPDAKVSSAERTLIQRMEEALGLLDSFSTVDQQRIRAVLTTIMSGQELDLRRFGVANERNITALPSDLELDDYTHLVAGCVGEFWTKMCLAHLLAPDAMDSAMLIARGIRFGKGLQLVNILRDLPRDLRIGRCYLPSDRLAETGLLPAALLDPASESRLRPLYDSYLDMARDHLRAGWCYTNSLPFGQVRLRLACAWPILIGVQTIGKLRGSAVLNPNEIVKISRSEVRQIILRSLLFYPCKERWAGMVN